jgi:parallel beta-helix repeat protein
MKRVVLALMVMLITVGVLSSALDVQPAKADWTWTETITVNSDGSISPPTAPITSSDNITYTLTDNIVGHVPEDGFAITIGRSNTTFDGAGYTVQTTVMESHSTGIYWGAPNVTVQNVTIQNFYHGILLYDYHAYSLIAGNNITNNYAGIRLFMSSHVTISQNALAGNSFSLVLDSFDPGRPTYNNTVYENAISASGYGILLDKAQDNKLYHNHMDAGVSVSTSGYANSRDDGYPSGGNYWSDYEAKYPAAQEINESGIWDTPYVIDADNVDGFPLIHP